MKVLILGRHVVNKRCVYVLNVLWESDVLGWGFKRVHCTHWTSVMAVLLLEVERPVRASSSLCGCPGLPPDKTLSGVSAGMPRPLTVLLCWGAASRWAWCKGLRHTRVSECSLLSAPAATRLPAVCSVQLLGCIRLCDPWTAARQAVSLLSDQIRSVA